MPKKKDEKSVRVTQVCRSLIAQNVLQMSQEIKEKKKAAEMEREESKAKKKCHFEIFVKVKDICVCWKNKCVASGLKQCTICLCVMKSNCTKSKYKGGDGKMPVMDFLDHNKHKTRKIPQEHIDIDYECSDADFDDSSGYEPPLMVGWGEDEEF